MLRPPSAQGGIERIAGALPAEPGQSSKRWCELRWGKALPEAPGFAACALLACGLLLFGDAPKPKLAGTWELDPAKSKIEHGGAAIELTVVDSGGKLHDGLLAGRQRMLRR